MKRIVGSIILSVILFSNCFNVYAAYNGPPILSKEDIDYIDENIYLGEVLNFIYENYAGGEISKKQLLDDAIRGMTFSLDAYTLYYSEEEAEEFIDFLSAENYGIGVLLGTGDDGYFIIEEVFPDSPAEKVGLMSLDKITLIDGEDIKFYGIDAIVSNLTDKEKPSVVLTVERNGVTKNYTVQKEVFSVKTVYEEPIDRLIDVPEKYRNSIGYIKLTNIFEQTSEDFRVEVKNLQEKGVKNLILDLRDNGGGFLEAAMEICDLLVPEGLIVRYVTKQGGEVSFYSELKEPIFDNIVVLTNGETASAAEAIAGAVKDSGAGIIVGERTFGKGVIQQVLELTKGGFLKITMAEYFTRSGNKINHVGIPPTVNVSMPYFLSDAEDNSQENLFDVLKYIGFDVSNSIDAENAIAKLQKDEGQNVTGKLDGDTVRILNNALYKSFIRYDKILEEGLNQMLKIMAS